MDSHQCWALSVVNVDDVFRMYLMCWQFLYDHNIFNICVYNFWHFIYAIQFQYVLLRQGLASNSEGWGPWDGTRTDTCSQLAMSCFVRGGGSSVWRWYLHNYGSSIFREYILTRAKLFDTCVINIYLFKQIDLILQENMVLRWSSDIFGDLWWSSVLYCEATHVHVRLWRFWRGQCERNHLQQFMNALRLGQWTPRTFLSQTPPATVLMDRIWRTEVEFCVWRKYERKLWHFLWEEVAIMLLATSKAEWMQELLVLPPELLFRDRVAA